MQPADKKFPPLDVIAAGLGGKRIYGDLWLCCFVVPFLISLLADRDDPHPLEGPHASQIAALLLVLAVFSFSMVRAVFIPRYRKELFDRVPDEIKPSSEACLLIRIVPILGFCVPLSYWYFYR